MRRQLLFIAIALVLLACAGFLVDSVRSARVDRERTDGLPSVDLPSVDLPSGDLPSSDQRSRRSRVGGLDVTFIVTADTHFGFRGMAEKNAIAIGDMNAMEGRSFPAGLGTVGKPRGVLAAGDLTEDSRPEHWAAFVAHYGTDGTDGLLRFPVYETWGNHDKNNGWYVRHRIDERHGSVVYSFDWQDLHVVSLGEAPDHDDVAWLERDLARVGDDVGLVLFFHFPLEGPYSDNWFSSEYKDALVGALAGHHVLGIFHGHYHASGTYRFRDLDIFNVGSPKHGFESFAVVRVTDERMTVASWNYQRKAWWWWVDKPIFGAPGEAVRHVPPGLVGSSAR